MSKKNFKTGFESLLGDDNTQTTFENRPTQKKFSSPSSRRTTFIASEEHYEALKAIAYWDRKTIKDILHEALESYIREYKKNNGELALPKKN
jgi:hypothetical protein